MGLASVAVRDLFSVWHSQIHERTRLFQDGKVDKFFGGDGGRQNGIYDRGGGGGGGGGVWRVGRCS